MSAAKLDTMSSPKLDTSSSTEITARSKFLSQPGVYKDSVEVLKADGSNFSQWTRTLNRVIKLTLGYTSFFDGHQTSSCLTPAEDACLLFLIQATIHEALANTVDQHEKATQAFDALQSNFQGTTRFHQVELIDKLLNLKNESLDTDAQMLPSLFTQFFEIFSELSKIGAGFTPLLESLFVQAIVPPPTTMTRSQLFQNISFQVNNKIDVSGQDIQTIITSAYGEASRIENAPSSNPTHIRAWNTSISNRILPSPGGASSKISRSNPPPYNAKRSHRNQVQTRPHSNREPTKADIDSALCNIRQGNTPPPPHLLVNTMCVYCNCTGHWRSNCPLLRQDANLPPPDSGRRSTFAFERPATVLRRMKAPIVKYRLL